MHMYMSHAHVMLHAHVHVYYLFSCQVGGTSYGVSAVRGEESRKRWMRRYWAYRKEQGLAAQVRGGGAGML